MPWETKATNNLSIGNIVKDSKPNRYKSKPWGITIPRLKNTSNTERNSNIQYKRFNMEAMNETLKPE